MRPYLLLGCLVACGIAPAQSIDLSGTFARMQQAQQQLRFQGTLIYRSGDQMEVFHIAPGSLSSDQSLRLLQLAPGQIRLDRDGQASMFPRLQWRASSVPDHLFDQIRAHYAISAESTAQVDGRPALPVRFEARDGWRFAQTLWMDQATGLLLKSELRQGKQVLAQSMLLQVQLTEAQAGASQDIPATAPQTDTALDIQGMPDGFYVMRHARHGEQQQWLVGDGLCGVSVFVEPLEGQGQRGSAQRGGLFSVAEVRNGRQLVAVGAAPEQTLTRLLAGVILPD